MESLTTSCLESLLLKVRNLCPRPITEFSRFEAMDLLEAIENAAQDSKHEKANDYRLTYETLRLKLHGSSDAQFRDFLLPLLGDKDQERIFDIVAKSRKTTGDVKERMLACQEGMLLQPLLALFAVSIVSSLVTPEQHVTKGGKTRVTHRQTMLAHLDFTIRKNKLMTDDQ